MMIMLRITYLCFGFVACAQWRLCLSSMCVHVCSVHSEKVAMERPYDVTPPYVTEIKQKLFLYSYESDVHAICTSCCSETSSPKIFSLG